MQTLDLEMLAPATPYRVSLGYLAVAAGLVSLCVASIDSAQS